MTKIDEIKSENFEDINNQINSEAEENEYLSLEEKNLLEEKISKILKNWRPVENLIFFEIEKLLYVFGFYFSVKKKNFLVKIFENFWNFFFFFKKFFIKENYDFNALALYSQEKNLKNAEDCLNKIFEFFEIIENFLFESFEIMDNLKQNKKIKKILKEKLFSFHYTLYSLYIIFRDFFSSENDFEFFELILKKKFSNKFEDYKIKSSQFNIDKEISGENNKDQFIKLDYLQYKNKKFSEEVNKFYFVNKFILL